ncbi:hypothetical protein ACHAXS_003724 [Conticribra weissflogii]
MRPILEILLMIMWWIPISEVEVVDQYQPDQHNSRLGQRSFSEADEMESFGNISSVFQRRCVSMKNFPCCLPTVPQK